MNSEEFKELYVGDADECYEVGGEGCQQVDSEEIIAGKHITYSTVYIVGDQYFCVDEMHSNSGYWHDSEFEGLEVYEVKPVIKTITAWEPV